MHVPLLIFFVYPDPKGSEENQFTPLGAGVNKLIFKRFWILYVLLPILILFILKAVCDQTTFVISQPIFYSVNFRLLKKSSQIKAIKVHYFIPYRNKILNKFFLSICASVHFGKGSKL